MAHFSFATEFKVFFIKIIFIYKNKLKQQAMNVQRLSKAFIPLYVLPIFDSDVEHFWVLLVFGIAFSQALLHLYSYLLERAKKQQNEE